MLPLPTKLPDQAVIDELKAKHGRVHVALLRHGAETFHVLHRTPRLIEWERFQAAIFDEAKRPGAYKELVQACLVDHPTAADWHKAMDVMPALGLKVGQQVAAAAGSAMEVEGKEL